MRVPRRRFAGLFVASLLTLGGVAVATHRWRRPAEGVDLDEETMAALQDLARGMGAPAPEPSQVQDLGEYLRRLPAASPLLASEYVRLCVALKRLSEQAGVRTKDWASPAQTSSLLEQYYEHVAVDDLVRYGGVVLPRGEVAIKDLLLFLAGEPAGVIEVLGNLQLDRDPRIPIEDASHVFSAHCAGCHQSTDVHHADVSAVRAFIEGGPVMSSRPELRRMTDSDLAAVIKYLKR